MVQSKRKKIIVAVALLVLSAVLMSTASFAWFAMNTRAKANNFNVEAYTDSLYLQISADENFSTVGTEADFSTTPAAPLMLVTNKRIGSSDLVYKGTFTPAGGNYNGTGTYYEQTDSDVEAGAFNYVKVELTDADKPSSLVNAYDDLEFIPLLSGTGDGSKYYYTKSNNGYVASQPSGNLKTYYTVAQPASGNFVSGNNYYTKDADGKFTAVPAATVEAEGAIPASTYISVTDGNPTAISTGTYAGEATVYWVKDGNNFVRKADLKLGADLGDYFTASLTAVTVASDSFDGTSVYYVKNGDDYVCLGKPAAAPVLNHMYWGRAYSSSLDAAQGTNTLNVLPYADDQNTEYYLKEVFYLRQGENTNHASNLKVSAVTVNGTVNSLTNAIRVLIVAESTSGEIAYATYSERDGKIMHNGTEGGQLFTTLLGDEQEVITVKAYIYFDGTDAAANNNNLGVLNGQTVSIEFSIDEQPYN